MSCTRHAHSTPRRAAACFRRTAQKKSERWAAAVANRVPVPAVYQPGRVGYVGKLEVVVFSEDACFPAAKWEPS